MKPNQFVKCKKSRVASNVLTKLTLFSTIIFLQDCSNNLNTSSNESNKSLSNTGNTNSNIALITPAILNDNLNTNSNDLDLGTTIDLTSKKHFKTLWIEPLWHSNYTSYSDVYTFLSKIKKMGFQQLVIAYSFSDWGQCYLYTPKNNLSFIAYNNYGPNSFSSVTVSSLNPELSCPNFNNTKNFLNFYFNASEALGLKILLGLSRTGDVYLLNDIYNSLNGNTSSMYMPGYNLNSRLSTAVALSQSMAADLYSQYGSYKAFEGWYLAHETHCLDVGANYYDPMASYLKSLSGKKIMISPTVDADICFGGTLLNFVESRKSLIDIYSYQDTLGAGTLFANGTTTNYYSDAARNQRLYELVNYGKLNSLALTHAQTGTEFQINVEAWEMNGSCGYGCAYGGSWTRIKNQLDTYWAYTQNLMLNEGNLLFDFGLSTLSFTEDSKEDLAAEAFTSGYILYLKN